MRNETYPRIRKTRTVVMIDTANINCAFDVVRKQMGLHPSTRLDFEKVIRGLTMGSEIVAKNIYIDSRADAQESGYRRFMDSFRHRGFNVVTKNPKYSRLANGDRKVKANFDVEIAVDIMEYVLYDQCNEIVLMTGDSDFDYLIRKVKSKGVHVTIISSLRTLSSELRDCADKLILLEDLRNIRELTFDPPSPQPRFPRERDQNRGWTR